MNTLLHDRIHPTSGRLLLAKPVIRANVRIMTPDELLTIARELHALGAVHVKIGPLEAVFPARAATEAPTFPAQRPLSETESFIQAALGSS